MKTKITVMKFKNISAVQMITLICTVFTFHSCQDFIPEYPDDRAGKATVQFDVTADNVNVVTRAVDENGINDLNIYMEGSNTGTVIHAFRYTSTPSLEVPYDDYQIWIIANAGYDMGYLPANRIEELTIEVPELSDYLIMSGRAEFSVKPGNGPIQKVPPVTLMRTCAKVAYNITISDDVKDMALQSVRFVNVPKRVALFKSATPNPDDEDYRNLPTVEIPGGRSFSGVAYLNENLKGERDFITDPRDKTIASAPANATLMLIRAQSGGVTYNYALYLGENTTTDFNVRRNTATTLNVNITGLNTFDWRVYSYMITTWEKDAFFQHPSTLYDYRKVIFVESSGRDYTFTGNLKIETADNYWVLINGNYSTDFTFNIPYNTEVVLNVESTKALITPENEDASYILQIRDDFDVIYEERRNFKFGNFYYVQANGSTQQERGYIDINAPWILWWYKDNNTYFVKGGNSEEPIRFEAIPYSNYEFIGWYAGDLREPFDTSPVLYYKPKSRLTELKYSFRRK